MCLFSTIVAPALPRIGSDFNQMTAVSWVATAYILTFDVFRKFWHLLKKKRSNY